MPEVVDVGVTECRRIVVAGRVQGVGFRPFVSRLAHALGLAGWVRNRAGRVEILARGHRGRLDRFVSELVLGAPPFARPRLESVGVCTAPELEGFRILDSQGGDVRDADVAPDQSVCEDCLAEIRDPSARRHRYPFANCTQCGPRYTIVRALPYDRANTTMSAFALCHACRREYEDPFDRRFHAEPIACPACGPRLRFTDAEGRSRMDNDQALAAAIEALQGGLTVAVKGIGGYHLVCDATREDVVVRLRFAKRRPHKPFAVMTPADGPFAPRRLALLDAVEEAALFDAARPIVLLRKRSDTPIAPAVAPRLSEIGLMLPYSPLHHLLLEGFGRPVVATSANLGGEPVLTKGADVARRLSRCCDGILHHDRPIERPTDDPVVRVIAGRPIPLRLGRGSAPVTIDVVHRAPEMILACGGQLRTTVALAVGDRVMISPHVGDMGSLRSLRVFEQVAVAMQALYGVEASKIVHDAHPDFAATRWAARQGKPTTAVPHHFAHASALLGEHGRTDTTLVFAWDGLGLGEDGELWGGETLLGSPGRWRRVGSFRPFRPIGGDRVAHEPWRSACALCWEAGVDWRPKSRDHQPLRAAWLDGSGRATSAVGRMFDAAAALLGLLEDASYDGHGPALVEAAASGPGACRPLPVAGAGPIRLIDWEPLVLLLNDATRDVAERAASFHAMLAATIATEAAHWRTAVGVTAVGLTGGVFQNRRLTEEAVRLLEADGFEILMHERVPPNDGGLSFGQAVEFAARNAVGSE